jgi:trigger factor
MEIKKILIGDSKLKKEFSVVIPRDLVMPAVDRAISERQKTYRQDGFRTGRVPLEIIKKREYVNCFHRTVDDFVNKLVFDIAGEYDYKLALSPEVNLKTMEPEDDSPIELSVIYELMPEIDNIDFRAIKLHKFRVLVDESDVDRYIENILAKYRNFVKKDGTAQMGDRVSINFSGTVNGKSFPGGYAEGFWLELGSKTLIGDFEEQIIGKNIRDEFDVEVVFPLDYHKSSLSGKTAVFRVKLVEILKPEKVTPSDEFFRDKFATENTEKFREILRDELVKNYSEYSREITKNRLLSYLDKNITFDLPEGLVKRQYDSLLESKEKQNLRNSLRDDIDTESIGKEAASMVRINLILSKICSENNISVSKSEISGKIMEKAEERPGHEMEIINLYRDRPELMGSLENMILEDKIIDFILENVSLEEKSVTVGELGEIK